MKSASVSEIKKELQTLNQQQLINHCMRMVKYKKDNKELLNYLLFESSDEDVFVKNMKHDIDCLFEEIVEGWNDNYFGSLQDFYED